MGSAPTSAAWITAMGAVTSVGLDAATTCASIRAGITRPSPLEGHESVAYLDYALPEIDDDRFGIEPYCA